MKPTLDDVREMVSALMNVASGLERAKREGKASTLALLYALAARERARPSELSIELGLHQSSITRQVQALEAAGQVDVAADPDDRRSFFVSLTDAGREEIDRLTEVGIGRFATFVAAWDADEVRTLARLLVKLEDSKAQIARNDSRPGGRRWQERKGRV
jgi:DNA-binding MarR family transcriptional regulator